MCKTDKTWEERVEGADTLAYLIEVDVNLQRIAAISDHILVTLSEYFKYPGSPLDASLMPTKKVVFNATVTVHHSDNSLFSCRIEADAIFFQTFTHHCPCRLCGRRIM